MDYLIKVKEIPFVEAVEMLCGNSSPPPVQAPPSKPRKPFHLPEAKRCAVAVISYLQRRSIDTEIIRSCIRAGILYESLNYQNCVFVGRDLSGCARAATLRGTRDKFKAEVEGSDKRFSFFLPAADAACFKLAVAESPIDALSVATLVKRTGGVWQDCHYLSLGGTSPKAMLQFLHDHPAITHVSLCMDNDKAGLEGIERLKLAIVQDATLNGRMKCVYPNPPPVRFGKDYNEFLPCEKREKDIKLYTQKKRE